MTNTKHTPGPWRAVDGRYTGVGIAHMRDGNYKHPYQVAAIVADDPMADRGWRYVAIINGKSTGEIDDNALLLAAAPDLYDALQWIAGACEQASGLPTCGERDFLQGITKHARAALAKVGV